MCVYIYIYILSSRILRRALPALIAASQTPAHAAVFVLYYYYY